MDIFYQLRRGQIKIKEYIESGGNPHVVDKNGRTLLHHVVLNLDGFYLTINYNPDYHTFKLLLEAGVDPLIIDNNKATIFDYFKPNYDFIKLLLENGYPVDHQNKKGSTILHNYVFQPDCLQLILQYEPDLDIKDNVGKRAIDYARQFNVKESIRLLQEHELPLKEPIHY